MMKTLRTVLVVALIGVLVLFNVITLRRASRKPASEPAAPAANASPNVFYGQIEPKGRLIRIRPSVSGIVRDIPVREGQTVRRGQVLCALDDAVERAEHEAALSRVEYSRRAAALSADRFKRGETLFRGGGTTESDFIQLKLTKELDEAQIDLRIKEADLAQAGLNLHTLRAPSDGRVYKCDIRPGEFFGPSDADRLWIGSVELELRCDLEALWIGRIDTSAACLVIHAETNQPLGKAFFVSFSGYLRPRSVSTEDPQERQSAKYQEVILRFVPERPGLPIGLPVMVKPETFPLQASPTPGTARHGHCGENVPRNENFL
jgi:multidrug efflux pump subunit AcrA (membrane-fusion protein)